MDVRAAVAHRAGDPLAIETLALSGLGDTEVLIEHRAAGLCHSDLHLIEGHTGCMFPLLPGHEGAGVVIETGRHVTGIAVGDHVVSCGMGECGRCSACRSDLTNICEVSGFYGLGASFRPSPHFTIGGDPIALLSQGATFSTHTMVDQMYVTPIPREIPFDTACLLGCAVLTGVGAALFTAKVRPGSTVVVIGLGGVGLNVIDGAVLAGAETIIGVDANPAKEAIGREFGMTHFVDPRAGGDLVEQIRDRTGGGADYAFECVGRPELVKAALQMTRSEWGTAVVIGVPTAPLQFDATEVMSGRILTGSYFGKAKTRTDLRKFADLLAAGELHTDKLVSHRIGLAEINHGFDMMKRGESIRTVIVY